MTGTGADIYCVLDLYHHTEKGPYEPGAGILSPYFTEERTEAQKG